MPREISLIGLAPQVSFLQRCLARTATGSLIEQTDHRGDLRRLHRRPHGAACFENDLAGYIRTEVATGAARRRGAEICRMLSPAARSSESGWHAGRCRPRSTISLQPTGDMGRPATRPLMSSRPSESGFASWASSWSSAAKGSARSSRSARVVPQLTGRRLEQPLPGGQVIEQSREQVGLLDRVRRLADRPVRVEIVITSERAEQGAS